MKRFVRNFLPILLLIVFTCWRTEAQQVRDTLATFRLEPKALKEDFQFLRRILTETHPGLYRYSSNEMMDKRLDSLSSLLNKPMMFYDYYLMLSWLIADIRCAHTHLMPLKNFEAYYVRGIKTFPLILFYTEGKYFVTLNGTTDTVIKPGFELLTINGRQIREIRSQLLNHLWADGYNETSKTKATTNAFFPLFYYLLVERPGSFEITFKDLNGEEGRIRVQAQTYAETEKFYQKNPVNREILAKYKSQNKLDRKNGWRMKVQKEENVAILRINGFGGGKNEEEARMKMQKFLDGCMKQLRQEKIQNLIIDLRFNGGGWDIQGVELFTYIMKSPARCYRRLHSVTDSSEFLRFSDLSPADRKNVKKELKREPDNTFSVREEFSPQLKMQSPKANGFKGRVYVLSNGGSGSTTSEFIAYSKSHGAITLIGEETGGAYEGGNGGSFLNFVLPHSKISIGTPLLYYDNEVTPPNQPGRGTMPDFSVPYNIEDVLKGFDTQLNFALKLIQKEGLNK